MNNIESIKAGLEKSNQLEAIINPPATTSATKVKKARLPLARDVRTVENILNEKIKDKETKLGENQVKDAKIKWDPQIKMIHLKAIALKQEVMALAKAIEKDSGGLVKLNSNSYSAYWEDMPENMREALENEAIEATDNKNPAIESMKKLVEEQILDIRLGMAPISNVKVLMEKIDKIV